MDSPDGRHDVGRVADLMGDIRMRPERDGDSEAPQATDTSRVDMSDAMHMHGSERFAPNSVVVPNATSYIPELASAAGLPAANYPLRKARSQLIEAPSDSSKWPRYHPGPAPVISAAHNFPLGILARNTVYSQSQQLAMEADAAVHQPGEGHPRHGETGERSAVPSRRPSLYNSVEWEPFGDNSFASASGSRRASVTGAAAPRSSPHDTRALYNAHLAAVANHMATANTSTPLRGDAGYRDHATLPADHGAPSHSAAVAAAVAATLQSTNKYASMPDLFHRSGPVSHTGGGGGPSLVGLDDGSTLPGAGIGRGPPTHYISPPTHSTHGYQGVQQPSHPHYGQSYQYPSQQHQQLQHQQLQHQQIQHYQQQQAVPAPPLPLRRSSAVAINMGVPDGMPLYGTSAGRYGGNDREWNGGSWTAGVPLPPSHYSTYPLSQPQPPAYSNYPTQQPQSQHQQHHQQKRNVRQSFDASSPSSSHSQLPSSYAQQPQPQPQPQTQTQTQSQPEPQHAQQHQQQHRTRRTSVVANLPTSAPMPPPALRESVRPQPPPPPYPSQQ
ncbi:hypothetical protein HKX48_006101 [Thoreauomyces humboldtii]|nr:hypothetical protein HKX48_006101 [Thoreauomyces humboldtii]